MRNLFDNPFLLVVLLLIIVLVFGSKRLPDAARSVGRSMRIFKTEVKEMKDDDAPAEREPTRPLEGRVMNERDVRTDRSDPDRAQPQPQPQHGDDPRRSA